MLEGDQTTEETVTDVEETETPTQSETQQPVEDTKPSESDDSDLDLPEEETEESETTEDAPIVDAPQEPNTPDYKQKFKDSARESILNAERVKVSNAQIEKLTKADTPTDEAMRSLYPEWDEFNDITKKTLVNQEAQSMRQRRIEKQNQDILDRQKLEDDLETVIDDNPKLQGKEAEFKRFAKNPKNKGISAEVLVKAFLFDVEEDTPAPKPTPRAAIPQGNGGPRDPLKPKKISLEEAGKIRENDYPRYLELVKNDMIDDDID